MSELIDRQEMAIRYLLGDLSEKDRKDLEQQFFSDDEVFQELEIAEDELIDRFVRAELSPDEMLRFEKLLVSPRLSERVELARILAQKVLPPPPKPVLNPDPVPDPDSVSNPDSPRPWWKNLFEFSSLSPAYRAAFAGALSLLMLLSVAIFFVKRSRDEFRRLAAEQQQQEERRRIEGQTPGNEKAEGTPEQAKDEKEKKEEQLQPPQDYQQKPKEPRRPITIAYLNPSSGTRSGGGSTKTIELRKGVSQYELFLNVSDGEWSRYNARLENLDGNEISHHNSLKPLAHRGGKYIRYPVPATELIPGTYIVHVDGITESGEVDNFADYPFRVVAR